MAGMFWQNIYPSSVQIDSLLSEEGTTLKKLMDAEDILQECKSQNKKLIEFLTRPDILEELVNLIIEEPPEDLEERWRYKYSYIACELLTCNVPILLEKLAGDELLMSKLYSFIDQDQTLNPLLASFFSKTLHALLSRASDQNWFSYQFACLKVLESLTSRNNCVDSLLQHIQTSAIMDLILVLLTEIEGDEMNQNIMIWLDSQQLVQRLIKLLSPTSDPEKHANASQLLCDFITSTSSLVEPEKRFFPILQTLHSNIVSDEQREKFALIIASYLSKFNNLLLNPPEKPSVRTTAGFLEKPFGHSRLYILRLYVSLLSTGNKKVLRDFAESDTFNIVLDLFFQFAWNNFLHTQVQRCLSLAMNCDCHETNEILFHYIFVKSQLIERILKAWDNNDNELNRQNGVRQGYMGHLITIVNDLVKRCEDCEELSQFLKANMTLELMQDWESFKSSKLDEINKKEQMTLGEPPENYMMSSSGNLDEYGSFPQDSYGQEIYSNYQQMTSLPFVTDSDTGDDGFQMEKFGDGESPFQNPDDQSFTSLFNIPNDDYGKGQDLFNRLCDEKKFGDVDQDDMWSQSTDLTRKSSNWFNKRNSDSSSSDEDDKDEMSAQVESSDPWSSVKSSSMPGSTSINLWSMNTPEPVEQTGWANFDNFESAFTSANTSFENKLCNDTKVGLPEVPIKVDEHILLPRDEDISKIDSNEENENVNETNDSESKTEECIVSSLTNLDHIETAITLPDRNANVTVVESKTSESKNHGDSLEEDFKNESEASAEELIKVLKTTENISSTTNVITDPAD
ncbi:hypothetical protein QAD02_008527 [Eretmocerus hayati]|uniref:Uncharacterized protein n=1 Tax=Eretmocerus hayati TaxID=131215 RepID=A0ACC2N6P3_9HYME|nr:hypothetical protein QAD02_008527 [Eretmocerus hayati]